MVIYLGGGITFTYNENGVVIRADYGIINGTQTYILYQTNGSGQRVSGTEYEWDSDTSAYIASGRTYTFTYNVNGYEEVVTTLFNSAIEQTVTAEYSSDYSYITQLTYRDFNGDIFEYVRYDELHRITEKAGMNGQSCYGIEYQYSAKIGDENISCIYGYLENTDLISDVEIYVNSVLALTLSYTLSESGLYQSLEARDADGKLVATSLYSNVRIIDGDYTQVISPFDLDSSDNFEFYEGPYYNIITSDFESGWYSRWPKVYEEGSLAEGVIPFYYEVY